MQQQESEWVSPEQEALEWAQSQEPQESQSQEEPLQSDQSESSEDATPEPKAAAEESEGEAKPEGESQPEATLEPEPDTLDSLRAKVAAAQQRRLAEQPKAEPEVSTEDKLAAALEKFSGAQSANANAVAALEALKRGDLEEYGRLSGHDPRSTYKAITDEVLKPGERASEERFASQSDQIRELTERLEGYEKKAAEAAEQARLDATIKEAQQRFLGLVTEESAPALSAFDADVRLRYGMDAARELNQAIDAGVLKIESPQAFEAKALELAEGNLRSILQRVGPAMGWRPPEGEAKKDSGGTDREQTKTLTNDAVSEVASEPPDAYDDRSLLRDAIAFAKKQQT